MNTIFINSENSKTSKAHILMHKLTNELDLRIGKKIISLSNLSIYYTCKNIKSSYNSRKKLVDKVLMKWKLLVKMSIKMNAVLAQYILYCFQYFLHSASNWHLFCLLQIQES